MNTSTWRTAQVVRASGAFWLVRKGYRPIEIPVNYRSRSFRVGKQGSIWRDPPTWFGRSSGSA